MTSLLPVPVQAPTVEPEAALPSTGRERELKFLIDKAGMQAALALPIMRQNGASGATRRLQTVYFDTPAGDLAKQGMALRMRRVRGGYVMGLKWKAGGGEGTFSRGEAEVKVRSPEPDLALFGDEVATELARIIGTGPLQPVFASDVRRVTRTITSLGASVEVAFDSGFLLAGEKRETVSEMELELKAGNPTDLYQIGLAVVDLLPVRLGISSKAERGALLVTGRQPDPVKAGTPQIDADTSMDDSIGLVILDCLGQFTANWPAFADGSRPEAVHQMRVAMRRLRAALAFFRREFPCPDFDGFRAQAKRIASTMGEARDWDVFGDLVTVGPAESRRESQGFSLLLAGAAERARAGHAEVEKLLANRQTTRFVLQLEHFVARRGWRNAADGRELVSLTRPVRVFAAQCLDRLDRRVRKRGRRIAELSAEDRHKVRIALKNLRYAADFFGHLFSPKADVRRFARRAAGLQDILGHLNDTETAQRCLDALDPGSDSDLAFAAGLMMGWHRRNSETCIEALERSWRAFTKAERYWRDAISRD